MKPAEQFIVDHWPEIVSGAGVVVYAISARVSFLNKTGENRANGWRKPKMETVRKRVGAVALSAAWPAVLTWKFLIRRPIQSMLWPIRPVIDRLKKKEEEGYEL